jgi:iron complex outermembrane receptor protein
LWLDNSYFGQIASLQYKNLGTQLTLGGGWNRYNGHHYGEIVWADAGVPDHFRWYDHLAHKTDVNLYGKWQQRLAAGLEAFIDMQYRNVKYDINGFRDNPGVKIDENYHFLNPKLGLSYQFSDHQVYLSYSRGQKEPNRDDFEAGANQVPKPEKLNDFELGIEKRIGDWKWGATAYYMLYKDQLVLTGKINDVGAYTRVNIPDSYRLGIELQGSVRWQSWLTASANLTLSRNKVKNFTEYYDDYDNGGQKSINHGTTDIALSPACVGSVVLSFYPVKRAEIALVGKYVSRQFLDNTSNQARSLNPYYVQDLRISYTLEKFVVKSTSLLLQVNNLFNKKYEPNGYTFSYQYGGQLITENYYFPMAGINLLLGVNIKL